MRGRVPVTRDQGPWTILAHATRPRTSFDASPAVDDPPGMRRIATPRPVPPAAPPIPVTPAQTDAILRTLTQYVEALTDRDVDAAVQAWPSVDRRALRDAFQTLATNQVALNACAIDVDVRETTVATCRVTVAYVPTMGPRVPRRTSQQWQFTMQHVREIWTIQRATVAEEP